MDIEREIDALEHAISTESARIDAMTAAMAGVLEAAKGNPEVAKAVSARLDEEYALQQARAPGPHYMQGFDVMQRYLRKLIE
jgi:hypothetical protein